MTLASPLPFGLRDVKITPYTDATCLALGAPIDLPNSRKYSFVETESFENLEGDDSIVSTHGGGPSVTWELEGGGVSYEVIRAIYGATITDSGTTPNQKRVLRKRKGGVRPWFRVEGQMISDNGGDLHGIVYRCRATGDFAGEFALNQFFLTGASGIGLPSLVVADDEALWDFVQNETVTAIS